MIMSIAFLLLFVATFLVALTSSFSSQQQKNVRFFSSFSSSSSYTIASASTTTFGMMADTTTTSSSNTNTPYDQTQSTSNSNSISTYVKCGRCQTAYAINEQDLGVHGKGRRLECTVCHHSWFQSRDRLMTLREGYEMVALPELDQRRITLNLLEKKNPRFVGDVKLYVGNLSFDTTERDLIDLFETKGIVSQVSLVRDDRGRIRGFGFITMRTKEGGRKAMEELDGTQVMGRTIAVRESNN